MYWVRVEEDLPKVDELVFAVAKTVSWDGEEIEIYGTTRLIKHRHGITWIPINTFGDPEKITHWARIEKP